MSKTNEMFSQEIVACLKFFCAEIIAIRHTRSQVRSVDQIAARLEKSAFLIARRHARSRHCRTATIPLIEMSGKSNVD